MKRRPLAPYISTSLRVVNWMLYLGVVPPECNAEGFIRMVNAQRTLYEQTRAKYVDLAMEEALDLAEEARLRAQPPAEEDERDKMRWTRSFPKNNPHLDVLRKDLSRTYSGDPFFCDPHTRRLMERVLYIWVTEQELDGSGSPQNKQEYGYRQGMNELLAIVLIALKQQSTQPPPDPWQWPMDQKLLQLYQEQYREHDAYALFAHLMAIVHPIFGPPRSSGGMSEIQLQIQRIFRLLLRKFDAGLYQHLTDLEVEPQLFMLRWIRVLFTREFSLPQVLVVWDALIISRMKLVDFVCVALLGQARDQLLMSDGTETLRFLMQYPALSDEQVQRVLSVAQELMNMMICEQRYLAYAPPHGGAAAARASPSPNKLPPGPASVGNVYTGHGAAARRAISLSRSTSFSDPQGEGAGPAANLPTRTPPTPGRPAAHPSHPSSSPATNSSGSSSGAAAAGGSYLEDMGRTWFRITGSSLFGSYGAGSSNAQGNGGGGSNSSPSGKDSTGSSSKGSRAGEGAAAKSPTASSSLPARSSSPPSFKNLSASSLGFSSSSPVPVHKALADLASKSPAALTPSNTTPANFPRSSLQTRQLHTKDGLAGLMGGLAMDGDGGLIHSQSELSDLNWVSPKTGN
eukprot:g33665.t1